MSLFWWVLLIIVLVIIIAIIATVIIGIIFLVKFIGYILGFIVGFIINWGIQIGVLFLFGMYTVGIVNILVWAIMAISGAVGSSLLINNWWYLLSIPFGFEIFFANLFAMGVASLTSSTPKAYFVALTSDGPIQFELNADRKLNDILAEDFKSLELTRMCFSDTDECTDVNKGYPLETILEKNIQDLGWNGHHKVILY